MNDFFLKLYLKVSRSDFMTYERKQITSSLNLWPLKFLVFASTMVLVMFLKMNEGNLDDSIKTLVKIAIVLIYLSYFAYCIYLDKKIFFESFGKNQKLALYKIFFYGLEIIIALYLLRLIYTILSF